MDQGPGRLTAFAPEPQISATRAVCAGERGDADAIALERVSKGFGDVQAVSDVSLTIHRGEFVSLLGPSGSGKTTVLRIVGGFERQDAGTVRVHGEVVDGLPPNRRAVNTVFQRYALFPHMTVGENLEFPLKLARVDRSERARQVTAMLELVQLPELARANVLKLSGGQAQRVALARALICRPRVLLLDEPLAALDLKLRKTLQLELRKVQEEVGTTFFYVTHDQEEALTMSDRIVLMNRGQIVQVGAPEEIYERPASVFASHFIGESNLLAGVGSRRDGSLVRLTATDTEMTARADVQLGECVTVSVRPERITMRAVGTVAPDGEWNTLEGRVTRRIYLGPISRWLVEVAPDTVLTVETSADAEPRPQQGERILCSWRRDDTVVVRDALE